MPIISMEELTRIGQELYQQLGASPEEATTVVDLLIESSLDGHDSHGVRRLLQYVAGIRTGKIIPKAKIEIEMETPATAVLNGNWGFGHVTAMEAMKIAIQKAQEASVGIVTVYQCNHVGRLGGYLPMATSQGMVGIVSNNGHGGDLSMSPWGGIGRILPPNCLAVAFPSDHEFPVVLDLTTAVAAGGKVRLALERGEQIPKEWLSDAEGRPTTDPTVYVTDPRGALQPFGGTVGHKGFGLAIVLDILSGALSPAGCSRMNADVSGNALFVQAIRIEAFKPLEEFKAEVGQFINYVKSATPAPGFDEVMVPGERSYKTRTHRLKKGIPVEDETWGEICTVAKDLGIKL